MRTLTFAFSAGGEIYRGSVTLPDEYFNEHGIPKWNLLNARFSAPVILWDRPVGGVQHDEPVVNKATPPIGPELQKLREVISALEKKVMG